MSSFTSVNVGKWDNVMCDVIFFPHQGPAVSMATCTQQLTQPKPNRLQYPDRYAWLTHLPSLSISLSLFFSSDASSFLFVQSFCLLAEWAATREDWIHHCCWYINNRLTPSFFNLFKNPAPWSYSYLFSFTELTPRWLELSRSKKLQSQVM